VSHSVNGWICRDFTAEAIAEGLSYFLTDPDRARRAGDAARASEQEFSHDRFARGWAEVFSAAPDVEPSAAPVQPF
jgi:glycosyltransferase involved in cell wall biosynthesis